MGAATVVVGTQRGDGGRAQHSGSNWLELAKNKFTKSDFTSFSFKLIQIHLTSVFSHSKRLIFKIRQTVAGTNITSHFHKFYQSQYLAGFCYLAQLCGGGMTAAGSLLESPRDNKKRDKKSESRSMPPLDY
jgi:hypothetical protein